jgi:hypothetical protein
VYTKDPLKKKLVFESNGYLQRCYVALKQKETSEPKKRRMFHLELETYNNANNL